MKDIKIKIKSMRLCFLRELPALRGEISFFIKYKEFTIKTDKLGA
jgi:hypothetical protein